MLSIELTSALRGYPLEYETYPLSFNEYCRFKGIDTSSHLEQDKARLRNSFEAYNQESAFPEIVLTSSKSEQLKLLHGYSLSEASTFVEVIEKRQGLKIACLEGIALRQGWITPDKMRQAAQPMIKNQYGQYLLKVVQEVEGE